MSRTNAEIMAVADLYAEALLAAAPEKEQQREVASQLADLVGFMASEPQFAQFLKAGTVDDDARCETLEKLFRGKMNDLLLNLLQVLNRRRRTELVPAISRCVELRLEEQREQCEVTVHSALRLWHELRTAIQRVLGLWLSKSVILVEEVDPELIGGIVLQIGDLRIDGSLRSRIDKMRLKLRDRAGHELHAGSSRYATAIGT